MEKISLAGRVRDGDLLHAVNEEWSSLRNAKGRKANWIGLTLRSNCLSKTRCWRKDRKN